MVCAVAGTSVCLAFGALAGGCQTGMPLRLQSDEREMRPHGYLCHHGGMTAQLDFTALPPAEAEQMAQLHPELRERLAAGASMFVVTAADESTARAVSETLSALHLVAPQVSMEALIAAMTPAPVAGRGFVVQAQRNAAARDALTREFGLLTGAEVAVLADSSAKNAAATAARWRKNKLIFSVPTAGGLGYPTFQFDGSGRPLPAVADVIAELGDRLDPWALALWFVGNNTYLGGSRPVDVLDSDPGPVRLAARRVAEQIA